MEEKDIFAQILSLGGFDNLKIEKDEIIENRKKLGKLMGKSRQEAKEEKCFYCEELCSKFCNSHSIPAFLIRNISVDGEVYNSNKVIQLPLLDEEVGVNKTGTFHLICRDCDSKIFSDYENPDNYKLKPTDKMIAQIAMKNYLKSISKRKFEMPLYNNMNTDYEIPNNLFEARQYNNDLDLKEYIDGFRKAKRICEKGWKHEYYPFYYSKLDYVVPFAFQSNVCLVTDLEGNLINQIYNKSPKYILKPIHICVFPMQNESIIMMFVDSGDKRYRRFIKQFNKLSDEGKLQAINFIIFSLAEDVYISKQLDGTVWSNDKFKEVCAKSQDIVSLEPVQDPYKLVKESFNFNQMSEIPNLLAENYKLKLQLSNDNA